MMRIFGDTNKGLSPVRRRLYFPTTSNHGRSFKYKALQIRVVLAMWIVLSASLSTLLFTWTLATTVDQSRILETGNIVNIGQHGPFRRITMSREMLQVQNTSNHKKKTNALARLKELRRPPAIPLALEDRIPHDSPTKISTLNNTEDTTTSSSEEPAAAGTATPLRVPPKLISATPSLILDFNAEVPTHLRIAESEKVVQVINTRFMQHQPQLLELGLARLELFKTICLPTLIEQSSQNFLWIIRADPDLHKTVKNSLLEVIQTVSTNLHVVVIGSNDNPNGFRRGLTDHPDKIWTNNYALLQHFYEAAQSRIVLETRLDADDGLHRFFIKTMQEDAVRYLDNQLKPNWLVWCAGTHVEWQYGTPWDDLPQQKEINSTNDAAGHKNLTSNAGDSSFGSLLPGLTRGCITPGLTKGYGKDVSFEEVPEAQHHMLHWQLKQCKDEMPEWYHCLVVWKRLVPSAIRGRTPTSAGMQFVLGKHISDLSAESEETLGLKNINFLDKQDMMWASVIPRFGITKESIRKMREYLTAHMHGIALDNLEGQCTKGHSCKNSSQEILQKLVQET